MKHFIALSILILSLLITSSKCDLRECDDKDFPLLSDIPRPSSEEPEENLRDVMRLWVCSMKKSLKQFSEKLKGNAEKLHENVGEGVKKFALKAKDVGSDLKTKFYDFKERLNKDSDEAVVSDKKFFLENVEIINPDIFKADQECGHGHILDSLGNCRKLRK